LVKIPTAGTDLPIIVAFTQHACRECGDAAEVLQLGDKTARSVERGMSAWRLAGAATKDRTMKAALQNYHARMQRVLDHIDRHLEDDLDLDALSSVAAYSRYHFHRPFTATFGLSVHRHIQLARMKRASYRLVR
jgi:AraC family transcriptional regulator